MKQIMLNPDEVQRLLDLKQISIKEDNRVEWSQGLVRKMMFLDEFVQLADQGNLFIDRHTMTLWTKE